MIYLSKDKKYEIHEYCLYERCTGFWDPPLKPIAEFYGSDDPERRKVIKYMKAKPIYFERTEK